jgi:hypothetical protein
VTSWIRIPNDEAVRRDEWSNRTSAFLVGFYLLQTLMMNCLLWVDSSHSHSINISEPETNNTVSNERLLLLFGPNLFGAKSTHIGTRCSLEQEAVPGIWWFSRNSGLRAPGFWRKLEPGFGLIETKTGWN